MKRLHMHISVEDLAQSIKFYTALFGIEPTKLKEDYAQWLVDEPAVNLAISSGRDKIGLNHMGLQVDSDEAVQELEERLQAAGVAGEKQKEAVCCYAKSNKYWVQDPQGIIWENYHTMEQAEFFGGDSFTGGSGCCQPSFADGAKWTTSKCS